jgi:hypothetical protein
MAAWRDLIAAGDRETIDKAFIDAAAARDRWLSQRSKGAWEEDVNPPAERPSMLSSLFGMGRRSAKRQQKPT